MAYESIIFVSNLGNIHLTAVSMAIQTMMPEVSYIQTLWFRFHEQELIVKV